jgi:diamine N-acetyltransferase
MEGAMVQIKLEEANAVNFYALCNLRLGDNIPEEYLGHGASYFIAVSKIDSNYIPMAIVDVSGAFTCEEFEEGKAAVGFIGYHIPTKADGIKDADEDLEERKDYYTIAGFMIDEKYRRRGYGKKALELLLDNIKKDKNHNRIQLTVHQENVAAIELYEKAGFRYKERANWFIVDEEKGIWHSYNIMELFY